jgi:hypothetical protein
MLFIGFIVIGFNLIVLKTASENNEKYDNEIQKQYESTSQLRPSSSNPTTNTITITTTSNNNITIDQGLILYSLTIAPWDKDIPRNEDACFIHVTQRKEKDERTPAIVSDELTKNDSNNYEYCGTEANFKTSQMCTGAPVCFQYNNDTKIGVKLKIDFISQSQFPKVYYENELRSDTSVCSKKINGIDLRSIISRYGPNRYVTSFKHAHLEPWIDQHAFEQSVKGEIIYKHEPTLIVPQSNDGPNIYHVAGTINNAWQWWGDLSAYGLTDAIEDVALIGDTRLGNWGKQFLNASMPEGAQLHNIIDLVEKTSKDNVICYTNPVVIDMGYPLLQYTNKTELAHNEPPIFNRHAHATKERVWRRLGLESQITGEAKDLPVEELDQYLIQPDSELELLAAPKVLTYIYRAPPPPPTLPGEKSRSWSKKIGHPRVLDESSEAQLQRMLQNFAKENGYEYHVINFDGKDFREQVTAMHKSGIIVALHGAGLVNSQFVPSGGALIEISPHNFHRAVHYIQGGHTNLWYSQYIVETVGESGEFHGLESMFHGDARACCYENKNCKRFYRDQVVKLGNFDIAELQRRVELASEFIELQNSTNGLRVLKEG